LTMSGSLNDCSSCLCVSLHTPFSRHVPDPHPGCWEIGYKLTVVTLLKLFPSTYRCFLPSRCVPCTYQDWTESLCSVWRHSLWIQTRGQNIEQFWKWNVQMGPCEPASRPSSCGP
jgi:hypothetical protein